MKRTQIVATLAFASILGIAAPVVAQVAPVAAAEQNDTNSNSAADISTLSGSVAVTSVDEFKQALANDQITEIVLSNDLTDLWVSITRSVTINLAGHTITNTGNKATFVSHGNVVFTGGGTINSVVDSLIIHGAPTSGETNYTVVTIDEGVTLHSESYYGISIMPDYDGNHTAYGVTVNMNGNITGAYGISINGLVQNETNRPQITIGDTATIDTQSIADSTPIYAAGTGDWTVGSATLKGNAAVAMKAGTFTFNNTNVAITGPEVDVTPISNGIIGTGSVFQIEHNDDYVNDVILNVNGGTYTSSQADVFYEYEKTTNARVSIVPADINITAGTFTAGDGKAIFGGNMANVDVEIRGGTFKGTDVADFAENGYLVGNLIVDANGQVRPVYSGSTGGSSSSSNPSITDPTDAPTPDDGNDADSTVPNTGSTLSRGISSAINTIAPLLIGAGFMFMFFSGKIHERHHARRLSAIETEVDAEVEQIIDEPEEEEDEPVIDCFVAEPIARDDPELPHVDVFVPQDK